jgi:8-oxo-dGTP pyrophosphatase MutT (NUDIX family)
VLWHLNALKCYLEFDETWQQGVRKELHEETGIDIIEQEISLYDVQRGLNHKHLSPLLWEGIISLGLRAFCPH